MAASLVPGQLIYRHLLYVHPHERCVLRTPVEGAAVPVHEPGDLCEYLVSDKVVGLGALTGLCAGRGWHRV